MKRIQILAWLTLSLSASAQWTNNTLLNTEVKDSVGYEESVPLSVTTSDGKTWISYFSLYQGSYQMRLQLLDTAGYKLLGNDGLLVSNHPQSTALFRYDLKCDDSGNAIVAFQDTRTGGTLHAVTYKIDQQGNFAWGPNGIQLIDPVSTDGIAPAIGFTHAGNVIVAWNAGGSWPNWVAFQKITPAGNPVWSVNKRIADTLTNIRYNKATMVPCGADDFIMLYGQETGPGLPPSNMYAQRYDDNGDPVWSVPVHVSTKTTPFFFFFEAVADGQDGLYTAFNTSDNANPSIGDVYVQHVDSSGNLWNATGNQACGIPGTQRFAASAKADPASGNFWVLVKTTDLNQNNSGLAIQQFDINGSAVLPSSGVQLMPVAAAYYDPVDLTVTSDGVVSFFLTGGSMTQTISAKKCDFNGSPMWNGQPVFICSLNSGKDDLMSGLCINNQVVAVWTDYRNDYGIYAQNISNDGVTGPATGIAADDPEECMVYPNPVRDVLHITLPGNTGGRPAAVLRDAAGREIWNVRLNEPKEWIVGTEELAPGVYILELRGAQGSWLKRVVKAN